MRSLDRNKQYVYYKLYAGKQALVDADGYETGEQLIVYGDMQTARMNVSAARGTYEVQQFGQNANYSKTITTNDMSCPIDENSILWLGFGANKPTQTTPHNYIVVGVAKSINSITYAVREVKVNG